MLEFLLALGLAAGAVYFVLRPILHPAIAAAELGDADAGDEGEDPDDDLSPRAVALRALKEIEFDRATGKLSDGDYDVLRAQYTSEALAALRGEDRPAPAATRPLAEAGAATRPAPRAHCPVDGPRPETDAEFCSQCGRRVVMTGAGFCSRCGAPLEADARFCGRCGVTVAA